MKKYFPGYIPIEQLVSKQIDRIMHYKTIRKYDYWEDGIEGLIDLLTPEDEQKTLSHMKTNNISHDTTLKGQRQYSNLFRLIKTKFADQGIIWNTSGYSSRGGGGIDSDEDLGIKYIDED